MAKTVLITGGAGFIGSNLADRLLADGYRVVVVDNFDSYYDPSIKEQNVCDNIGNPNYELHRVDIRDAGSLDAVFERNDIDVVVHLAARAGVRPSIEQPELYADVNVSGTVSVLERMRKHGVKKIVFASSSSVYGNCSEDKFSETLDVNQPISPYAATKKACEEMLYVYHKLFGISVVALRFFTVYGERQRPDLAINKFVTLINNGQPIDMYGDGSSIRDYTYIGDIVDGIVASIDYDATGYEIINLAGGNPITLMEMVMSIQRALGKSTGINVLPKQAGDVDKTSGDITKASRLLGYKPAISFEKGISRFVEWKNTKK